MVFSGPHSYVSPSLYAERKSVPTWNYIAIHATGRLEVVADEPGDDAGNFARKDALLKRLIAANEPEYAGQWDSLPVAYRISMTAGIVGFRIPIRKLEGKFKLSQNRPEQDRKTVRDAHELGTPNQQALAAWMERLNR